MADQFPKDRKAEAGTAGEARAAAEKPPREDRDRYQGFSIEQVRKDNADAAADPPASAEKP